MAGRKQNQDKAAGEAQDLAEHLAQMGGEYHKSQERYSALIVAGALWGLAAAGHRIAAALEDQAAADKAPADA